MFNCQKMIAYTTKKCYNIYYDVDVNKYIVKEIIG